MKLSFLLGMVLLAFNAVAQPVSLTPAHGPEPKINGPKIFGVRPGHPIVFTIPASGKKPMSFSAGNLPAGVKVDAGNGRITGSIQKPGEYIISLQVKNEVGSSKRILKIVVGEDIALTPPMGWNHYNIYGTRITQADVLAQAKAMASSGLIDHGWSYMNIDDGWQGERGGPLHAIQPDTSRFRNMKQLSDEIHALGLKFGIYSTPWVESYGHRVGGTAMNPEGKFERTKEQIPRNKKQLPYAIGTYSFVDADVKQWALWDVDYMKYDWNPAELPETKTMYDALRNSGRDVVYSLSNSIPFATIAELSAVSNAWRTGGDIKDNWKSLKSRIPTQDKWAPFARPGHWNDPDMMIVGVVGWNAKDKWPSKLTPDEQYTHMSAWCLMSVPLLLGCDMTKLDDFTLGLLTNDEVIAINQDPLGKQATVVSKEGDLVVMAKDIEEGCKAAGLFNLADSGTQQLSLKWADLGIKGKYMVRDLWRQKDLGVFEGEFKTTVAEHGVVMVKLIPVPPPTLKSAMKPAVKNGGFKMPGYILWCPTVIKVGSTYHMFASRWPEQYGLAGWTKYSEVVRATSNNLYGPYTFQGVVLQKREGHWDNDRAHNPKIVKAGNTFVLYYISSANETGYAYANKITGPWTRMDSLAMPFSNPAPLVKKDGSVYVFGRKAINDIRLAQGYTAPSFKGPYSLLQEGNNLLPGLNQLEDPTIWWASGQYNVILSDFRGDATGVNKDGAQYASKDGIHYQLVSTESIYSKKVTYDDGSSFTFRRRERPFVFTNEKGAVTAFFTSCLTDKEQSWIEVQPVDNYVP